MPSASSAPRAALWQAVLRFETAKVRPWMALRNTIGIVLPVVAGSLIGHAASGLVAGIGALNVAVADGADSYAHRARRMLAASFLCSLAVVAGGLAGGAYGMPLILAAGAFAAGMMVAAGPAEADIGLIALVTLIVFSAQPLSSRQAFASGVVALGGGLVQTALALILWPLRRNMPERRALSDLYLELARAASAASPATEAPPASREITEAQQALASLDARDSLDAERFLALLSQAERIRLALLALARLRIRLAREAGTDRETGLLDRCAALASRALRHAGESVRRGEGSDPSPEWTREMAALAEDLRRASCSAPTAVPTLLADARAQVDALAGQLRAVLDLTAQTAGRGRVEFEQREAARPWRLQLAGTRSLLAASLRLEAAPFRHALRLAACVAAGEILARGLGWRRPYWVPMTVALVLKPDFTTTFSRGLQRLLGTLIGLVVSTALFHLLHPSPAGQLAFLAVFAFLLRAYGQANYGILAIAITSLIVFLFAVSGVSPSEVILARGLNTLAGGLIALLAYLVWPTWERTQVNEVVARMLDSYRAYFQAVRDAYLKQVNPSAPTLDRARLGARIGRSHLEASVARMRGEPGSPADRIAALDRILANSHRFIHAVMSLDAGLLASRPVPARDEFLSFSNHSDLTLYYLAAALRGAAIAPADFPDLREDHHALLQSGDLRTDRCAPLYLASDRTANTLTTLTAVCLPLIARPRTGPRP